MPRNSANAVRGRQGVWGARRGRSIMTKIVFCIAANLVFTVITGILLGPPPSDQVQAPAAQVLPTMAPQNSSAETAGFIHIGKTGGSTISMQLRNGCNSFKSGPCRNVTDETVVSKFVEHYYHVTDFFRLPTTNHKAFIMTVRDVFDRTASAFLYLHPKNIEVSGLSITRRQREIGPKAYACFPTLEHFSSLMIGNTSECNYNYHPADIHWEDCQALACAALHGKVRFFSHLFFNYQNILYTKIPTTPPRQIYLLRQEKLFDDWVSLNTLLGQKDPIKLPPSELNLRNVSSLQLPVTREISDQGRRKLCKALETEYMAYFRLLDRAININQRELEFCRQIAQQNCPNLDTLSMIKSITYNV